MQFLGRRQRFAVNTEGPVLRARLLLLALLYAIALVLMLQDADVMRMGMAGMLGEAAAWSVAGSLSAELAWRLTSRGAELHARLVLRAAITSVLGSVCWMVMHALFNMANARLLPSKQPPTDLMAVVSVLIFQTVVVFCWQSLHLYIRSSAKAAALREAHLQSQALAKEAELQMLRYQLDPHFLFNTLNTVGALVDESPSKARETIAALADLLRTTLVQAAPLTPLHQEAQTLQAYLAIIQARFEDRLVVHMQVADNARHVPVPPFLLQPLVENAVRHGFKAVRGTLRVDIDATLERDMLRVEVANPGRLLTTEREGGVGIVNVQRRLSALYGGQATFVLREDQGRVVATLLLPAHGPPP